MDINFRTFSIAPEKIMDIMRECVSMFLRDTFTKRELHSLLGKLLFVSRCVSQSRRFLNRMLATLRVNHVSRFISPDDSFERDLLWFIQFLISFNGVVTFRHFPVQYHVYVDNEMGKTSIHCRVPIGFTRLLFNYPIRDV